MCTSVIDALLSAVPFKAFSIEMQNGSEWEVDRPERVRVAGHQQVVYLHTANGDLLAVISAVHISHVTFPVYHAVPRPPLRGDAP